MMVSREPVLGHTFVMAQHLQALPLPTPSLEQMQVVVAAVLVWTLAWMQVRNPLEDRLAVVLLEEVLRPVLLRHNLLSALGRTMLLVYRHCSIGRVCKSWTRAFQCLYLAGAKGDEFLLRIDAAWKASATPQGYADED